MALFGKSESFAELVRRLEKIADRGGPELEELLMRVTTHEQAQPRRLAWMLTAKHPRVRIAGRELMASVGTSALDLLLEAMAGGDRDVKRELAADVLRSPKPELQRVMSRYAHAKKPEQRQAVLEVVNADPQWFDWMGILKKAIRDPERHLRIGAVRILCRGLDNETVRMVLRPLLHDEDDDVRCLVIQGFCDRPGPDVVEPFFARLPNESGNTRDRIVAALSSLSRAPGVELERYLVPILADDDPAMREFAVVLLAKLPDQTSVLRNVLLQVRGLASWLRDRTTEALLSKANLWVEAVVALMGDAELDVRVAAMAFADRISEPTIVPAVRRIFEGPDDWWVRGTAAEILVRFPQPGIVELLASQMDDEGLRYGIVAAFGKLKTPDATAMLLDLLNDPCAGMRSAALRSLAGCASDDVAQELTRVATSDTDAGVRARALDVLRSFGEATAGAVRSVERRQRTATPAASDEPMLEMANDDLNTSLTAEPEVAAK